MTIKHLDLIKKYLPTVPRFGLHAPHPIDSALNGNTLTVIFEDGRKLSFDTTIEPAPIKPASVQEINLSDGVSDTEASTAGKALRARKKKKTDLPSDH